MSPTKRRLTATERAEWAAYMREYRAKRRAENPQPRQPPKELRPTPRQLEILRLYVDPAMGGTQAKVAEALGISPSAVHNQLGRLMKRLNVNTVAQAVYKVYVEGAVDDVQPKRRVPREAPEALA